MIHSVIFTRMKRESTPGGPIVSVRERKMRGWRIDYFCVSQCLKDRLVDAKILTDIYGSDHCPVLLEMKEEA